MILKRLAWWSAALVSVALLALLIAYWASDNECPKNAAAHGELMKAVVYCDYGPPDVLAIEDIEKPMPGDDQLLVKVRSAGINPVDWHYMRGTPYIVRLDTGLRKPKMTRLGVDYAGTVEAVGKDVTGFKAGDEVFGGRNGALAAYITVLEDRAVVLKPANLTFEQAASVAVAAVTALQGLRDKGEVQPGDRVLINGASGGVGTFAVQIAKAFGAHVTGVCSTRNVELVRSIGADEVIDYTRENYTDGNEHYDVILDLVANHSLLDNRRVLEADGTYVLIGFGGGPESGRWLAPLAGPAKALLLSPFVDQEFVTLLAELNKEDLTVLRDLMQDKKVTPVIDRLYEFSQVADAVRYLETGRARGKVVIDVEPTDASDREPAVPAEDKSQLAAAF